MYHILLKEIGMLCPLIIKVGHILMLGIPICQRAKAPIQPCSQSSMFLVTPSKCFPISAEQAADSWHTDTHTRRVDVRYEATVCQRIYGHTSDTWPYIRCLLYITWYLYRTVEVLQSISAMPRPIFPFSPAFSANSLFRCQSPSLCQDPNTRAIPLFHSALLIYIDRAMFH